MSDIDITVGGDLAPLESALSEVPSLASQAAAAINQALSDTSGVDGMTTRLSDASRVLGSDLTNSATQASAALQGIPQAANQAADATQAASGATQGYSTQLQQIIGLLGQMTSAMQETAQSEQRVAAATEESAGALGRMSEVLEGAKRVAEAFVAVALVERLAGIATAAVEAYGQQERLATSLRLMGGSAEVAAAQLKTIDEMSTQLGLDQSELERTAQKLSVAFGPGDGLTGALRGAASIAAVTGQSLDSAASALERVQQTGQLSTRQVVALGLSWQDLAKTMGVSVTQAQELLKKGAQDAATDVQVLLDTINRKFAGAAEAQARGIVGQLTSLKSSLESLMEDVGSAIAPTLGVIVQQIQSTIIPAIRALVAEFKSLPPGVQEFVIVAGAAAAALVPLTAGLATLGFALQGLRVLMATTAPLFQTVAVAEGEAAVASVALTSAVSVEAASITGLSGVLTTASTATTAFGLAQGAAAVETVGLRAALATASAAMGIFGTILGGAGILAAAYAVEQLASGFIRLWEAQAGAEAATATHARALMALEIALKQQGIDIADLQRQYDQGVISEAQYMQQLTALVTAFRAAHPVVESTAAAYDRASAALKKLGQDQADLVAKVQQAKAVLDQAREGYAAGTVSLGTLAAAQDAYTKAVAAADPALKRLHASLEAAQADYDRVAIAYRTGAATAAQLTAAQDRLNTAYVNAHPPAAQHVQDLADLREKQVLASNAMREAAAVYDQAMAALRNGTGDVRAAQAAWEQYAHAAKEAGQTVYDAAQQVNAWVKSAQDGVTHLGALSQSFGALAAQGTGTVAQQKAIADAFREVSSLAASYGLQVQQAADGLVFYADAANAANPKVQDLARSLTALSGSSADFVTVNGRLVATLQSTTATAGTAQSQLNVLRSAHETAGAAASASASQHEQASTSITHVRDFAGEAAQRLEAYTQALRAMDPAALAAARDQLSLAEAAVEFAGDADSAAAAAAQLADALGGVAAAGTSAASAIQAASAAAAGFRDQGSYNFGGSGGFSTQGATQTLGMYAAAGATDGQLDQIAAALGLVKVANRSYITQEEAAAQQRSTSSGQTSTSSARAATATSSQSTQAAAAQAAIQAAWDQADQAKRALTTLQQSSSTAATGLSTLSDAVSSLSTSTGDAAKSITSSSTTVGYASQQIAQVAVGLAAAGSNASAGMMQLANALQVTLGSSTALNPAAAMGGTNPGLMKFEIHTTVQAGVVAGSGGMQELSNLVTRSVVTQLKQVAGLKL